jgi:DNA-binding GntR family transcriptional regulator
VTLPRPAPSEELTKVSLVDLAVTRLSADILDGRLPPGERLIEEQLTARFGISRAPLREALRLLAQQGLVEHLPRRGVRVARLSDRDVAELFGLRNALERYAVELALADGPPAHLGLVDDGLDAMQAAAEQEDGLALAAAHRAFHVGVVRLAGHEQLLAVYTPIVARLQLHMAANLAAERAVVDRSQSVARHRRLRDALAAGPAPRVLDELSRHGERSYFR